MDVSGTVALPIPDHRKATANIGGKNLCAIESETAWWEACCESKDGESCVSGNMIYLEKMSAALFDDSNGRLIFASSIPEFRRIV